MRAAVVVAWTSAALLTTGLAWVSATLGPKPAGHWTVTERLSAHHVLILQIETDDLTTAREIAAELTRPLPTGHYAEVLMYFHRPGRPDVLPPRRVQWTPAGGYVETVFQ